MDTRRRRSGALHASTFESYLDKAINLLVPGTQKVRKSSSHDVTFSNFEFGWGEQESGQLPLIIEPTPKKDSRIQLKILIIALNHPLSTEVLDQLIQKGRLNTGIYRLPKIHLDRSRSRASTNDSILTKNPIYQDFDFHYMEVIAPDDEDNSYSFHFWIVNNIQHKKMEFFKKHYYNCFNGVVVCTASSSPYEQKLFCSIKENRYLFQESCQIYNFIMDQLGSFDESPEKTLDLLSHPEGCSSEQQYNLWYILQKIISSSQFQSSK